MDPGHTQTEAPPGEGVVKPRLARLRVLAWIAVFLLGAELALEARAYRNGWEVLLFQQVRGANRGLEAGIGPTPEFPFRSRVFEMDATQPDLRIWMASSSYAEALEFPASEIFPVLIGEALHSEDLPVRILNASQMGSTIQKNLEDLRELAPLWRPDVCILYQLSNDLDWIVENGIGSQAEGQEATPLEPEATKSIAASVGPHLDRLIEESTLYKHLQTEVSSRLAGARPLRHRLEEEELDAFRSFVIAFVDECETQGIQPVLCTFAFAHPDPEELPAEWARLLLRSNMQLSPQAWSDAVQRGNDILRSIATERGLVMADLDAALSGHSERFRDPWHFDSEGHRIAAQVMADAVKLANVSN